MLAFVGVKMLLAEVFKLPIAVSLGVIATVIGGAIATSSRAGPSDVQSPPRASYLPAEPESEGSPLEYPGHGRGPPARRRDHGQQVRLGDDAARRRGADEFGVPHECRVVSAHRTPDLDGRVRPRAPRRAASR